MNHKEHLASYGEKLLNDFNNYLKEKKISTPETPFYISKIRFDLKKAIPLNTLGLEATDGERACKRWESRMVERTNPRTDQKYWYLEEWCAEYEGGV